MRLTALSLLLLTAAAPLAPGALRAQEAAATVSRATEDADSSGTLPVLMEMLYERTIFNIDVLTVSVGVDELTSRVLTGLAQRLEHEPGALADSVAHAMRGASDLLVRSRFHRDVGLDQFLDGMRDNLEGARKGGFVAPDGVERILAENEDVFSDLRGRGFRSGDAVTYRIRGDDVHMWVRDDTGQPLLEISSRGTHRRAAVVGSYFAPESEFRDGLVRSLVRSGG